MATRETQKKGKEADVKAHSLNDFSVGDLVWASVKGYPRCSMLRCAGNMGSSLA